MKNKIEDQIYELIKTKAASNIAMQGFSGLLGWPWTLAVDVGVVFTHYGPMLNEIRSMYGRSEMTADVISPIISGCTSELLSDIVLDKVIGQIPVIGFGANIICAKAMTWRLGILFAMLSSRGEEINSENVKYATRLIREVFPQKSSLCFEQPSRHDVHILLQRIAGVSVKSFNETLNIMLKKLETAQTIRIQDL